MTPAERAWVDALKVKRAKLATPVERIVFDNDPANGPIGLRVVAAVESGEFPTGANAAADAPRDLFPGLSAKLTRRAEA